MRRPSGASVVTVAQGLAACAAPAAHTVTESISTIRAARIQSLRMRFSSPTLAAASLLAGPSPKPGKM
jgi:hypothetical protein